MHIAPFALERYFAQYEFTAPYLLCSSDAESFSVQELLALEPGSQEALNALWLGYTESMGNRQLRETIATLYETMTPDNLLVHAGAQEAIMSFMQVALSPGDHVIVHAPCYQSLSEIPTALGCEVSLWQTQEETGWALDLDWLNDAIRHNTKAIVVNFPHNPTGYLPTAEVQQALVDIARKHHLLLFSDEVYRYSEYNPTERLPAACDRYENAVSLGVLSKTFGLAGLRIGWIATRNQELLQKMAGFKDYTSICNSAPSEFLATLALRNLDTLRQRNVRLMQDNIALADDFFHRYAHVFSWQAPKAGTIAFPRLCLEESIESFCHRLVEAEGVLLLPGTVFGQHNNHFRFGYGRKNVPEALIRLERFVGEH